MCQNSQLLPTLPINLPCPSFIFFVTFFLTPSECHTTTDINNAQLSINIVIKIFIIKYRLRQTLLKLFTIKRIQNFVPTIPNVPESEYLFGYNRTLVLYLLSVGKPYQSKISLYQQDSCCRQ